MGSEPRGLLRGLVVAVILVTAGFGLPARAALMRDPAARSRVAILPVAPAAAAPSVESAATAPSSRPGPSVVAPLAGDVALPFPATHVGLRWRGAESDAVDVRWRGPGEWGPWQRLAVWDDAGDDHAGIVASGLVRPDPGATGLAVRWPATARDVEAVIIDAGPDPADGGYSAPASATTGGVGQRRVAGEKAAQPPVITRREWGANEGMRKGHPEFAPISKLVVHHTVTANNDPDPAQTVRAIYAYHTRSNGWNDIGYNFLVDQQGRIYEGRFARQYRPGEAPTGEDDAGRGVIGAHAKAVNPGTAGVAMLGDYSGGYQPPGPAVDALVRLLAWKAARHDIDPKGASPFTAVDGSRRSFPNIAGHRDVGDTGCPGGRLYDRLPEIRQRVAETIGQPAAPAPPPPPAPLPPLPPPVPAFPGFWSVAADGRIRSYGDAVPAGDLAGRPLGGAVVSLAGTPSGRGYWMLGADGGVFAFGDAPFAGAATGHLRSPAIRLEPTPTGKGYWVLSAAGEVAAFGDAAFFGQVFPLPFQAVGIAATPSGRGYWIATADARVLPFGDAVLHSLIGGPLADSASWTLAGAVAGAAQPGAGERSTASPAATVAIAASPDGKGYWLLAADGGVFSFGVPFHGSVPARQPYANAVELRVTDSGGGYYVAGRDGAVFAFGDGDRRRERPAGGVSVVDVAFRPTATRPASSSVVPDVRPGVPDVSPGRLPGS
jgi:N-acetylmuramoyl-L-alanine amidase